MVLFHGTAPANRAVLGVGHGSQFDGGNSDTFFYKEKSFFDFEGFEEPKSRDSDSNIFLRFIKNLGAVKIVLGVKRFLLYIVFSAAFACLTGIVTNLIIS